MMRICHRCGTIYKTIHYRSRICDDCKTIKVLNKDLVDFIK